MLSKEIADFGCADRPACRMGLLLSGRDRPDKKCFEFVHRRSDFALGILVSDKLLNLIDGRVADGSQVGDPLQRRLFDRRGVHPTDHRSARRSPEPDMPPNPVVPHALIDNRTVSNTTMIASERDLPAGCR